MDAKHRCFFFLFFLIFQSTQGIAGSKEIGWPLSQCAACHGMDGNAAINKAWPKLAGQNVVYFIKSLKAFRSGKNEGRYSAVMRSLVAPLSEKEMLAIANYYAALPGDVDVAEIKLLPLGRRLYRGGDATKKIPACLACHGPAGLGNTTAGFPRLSGQHAVYLRMQLQAFRSGKRIDKQHYMMSTIAKRMNDAEINAVASYISGLYF